MLSYLEEFTIYCGTLTGVLVGNFSFKKESVEVIYSKTFKSRVYRFVIGIILMSVSFGIIKGIELLLRSSLVMNILKLIVMFLVGLWLSNGSIRVFVMNGHAHIKEENDG